MIYIGTSGYSYKDWTGSFYPKAMKSADQLKFYSQEFNFLEVNYTFYRVPEARSLEGMAKNVPDDFKFALKLHQTFTHDTGFNKDFRKALPALGDKLVLLLAQFPYSFKFTDESKDHILRLAEFSRLQGYLRVQAQKLDHRRSAEFLEGGPAQHSCS